MLRPTETLRALDAEYERDFTFARSYREALAVFVALRAEAGALNPESSEDWQDGLATTRAVARAVNGVPPEP